MKRLGIVLMIVGLLLTVITGFGFFTKKKVVDLGKIEINKQQPHRINWSPFVGVAVIIVGGVLFMAGPKKLD